MYEYIYQESLRRAKHKIWIMSDLQQSDPNRARECLDVSMADYEQMGKPADMIWYLGDSVEGSNYEHLVRMADMQEEAFVSTGLPVCYTIGNHDMDYSNSKPAGERPVIPFYEMIKSHKEWHTSPSYHYPYFKLPVGNYMVYFFCDHIAEDKSWCVTHGEVHGDASRYPYYDLYDRIRDEIAREDRPVITVSHYSYLGGNREAELLSRLLPLPENVKIHFYGHAHIGDFVCVKKDVYRRICWVDWHDIPQINVSSFEHVRGRKCRSVFLHIYEDDSFGIFFRNHDDHIFSEVYFPAKVNYTQSFPERH